MIKKCIFIFLLSMFCILTLTGCYDINSVESLGYVISIGLDDGETSTLKLSLQFAITDTPNSENGSSQSSKTTVSTVECSSIDSGISLINSYISKKITLSHCNLIVISESLAQKGVSKYIFTLFNNIELRPNCTVMVSRCDAEDYLNNSKPTLEPLSARYYELVLNSSNYTGYSEDVQLYSFYSSLLDNSSQCSAVLGGISMPDTHLQNTDNLPYAKLDSMYKADETPIKNETNTENIGLAVFYGDKLVGELNSIETLCNLIVTSKLQNATISVPNPFTQNSSIDIHIKLKNNTNNTVKIVNGFPYIEINCSVIANILSADNNSDYSSKEHLTQIEENINNYLKQEITSYCYKTSKDFNSDIVGFGNYIRKDFLTTKDFNNYNWLWNYQNSFFKVNVSSNVETGYLFMKN